MGLMRNIVFTYTISMQDLVRLNAVCVVIQLLLSCQAQAFALIYSQSNHQLDKVAQNWLKILNTFSEVIKIPLSSTLTDCVMRAVFVCMVTLSSTFKITRSAQILIETKKRLQSEFLFQEDEAVL